MKKALSLAVALGLGLTTAAYAETTEQKMKRLEAELNALADVVEQQQAKSGDGSSALSRTKIGGYGELHYNNTETDDGSKTKDELDFHRFVLFVSHDFNDKTRFFSELELEHSIAGDGKVGEIELEQAYIEHDITSNLQGKAGVIILPVGIMNETHEPTTFYGVERNPVEKNIVPATWWAGGVGLSGHNATGFSYDALIHEGLNVPDSFKIRSGRQKTGKATAKDFAATGRVKYTGVAGLELGVTGQYQSDFAQGASHGGDATLLETHAVYNKGKFGAKALYARWDLDGAAAKAANKDVQDGGYIEASYKITPKLGTFARYNVWDNGGTGDTEITQADIGVNYWLHDNVVFKADYQNQDANDKSKASDGFNLGVGYQF
ncbi:MAG: porin [Thiotrichaceae bacterium]